jgi:uncharacterized MAPEG superfamily protein
MSPILTILVYATILTFIAILLGAFLRNREWTAEGLRIGLSNRQHLPEPTPLGGRAERCAANSIEALLLFAPLALAAELSGLGAEALLGAQLFLIARVVYIPVYLAGIVYVRSLVWGVGVAGMAMMVLALL